MQSEQPKTPAARVVTTARDLDEVARACAAAERVGLDVESNGMFAYRGRVCTVQLGWSEGGHESIAIVDALAVKLDALAPMLAAERPIKIVHDVAFDARILAEIGLPLASVHDTAIAARMIGRTSTGLATLLASELAVTIAKEMQQHDWSQRPLGEDAIAYLAADVSHLGALDARLFDEVRARGIEAEVLCETEYRIATAAQAAREGDPRPPWVRVKGVDKVPAPELPIVRAIAAIREREAVARDVPVHRVMSAETVLAVARAKPTTTAALRKIRGVASAMGDRLASELVHAIGDAARAGAIPDEERRWLERPRLPPAEAKARREREARLSAWRKAEAAARGVDPQVVLPGHVLSDIADRGASTKGELAAIPGIGPFRVERYADAILRALTTEPPPKEGAS